MKVYERIFAYINENGIDPDLVAREAGLSYDVFRSMLEGKRILYSDQLRAICIALNVSPELFVKPENLPRAVS